MPGTKEGAAKATITRQQKYGTDFYAKIGVKGGAAGKGRSLTPETRRRISKSKRRTSRENKQTPS